MKKTKKTNKKMLHIIGIGASAGGLEALNQFFKYCPEDTGMAFVVIQHLSPDHKSMMSELLARNTKMKISIAEEEVELEPDHIYLIPSNKNIVLKGQKLKLLDRTPRHLLNLPIDLFFESIAQEQEEKSIGIVLSGTGSDGTRGAQAIKEAGGTMFVQDPESAKFDGMPLSLIENGLADYVLNAKELAIELLNFVTYQTTFSNVSIKRLEKEEYAIQQILGILKRNLNQDFFLYRRQTLVRRILKRMKVNHQETLSSYIDFLEDNHLEQRRLSKEFLIGVTKFFRDTEFFSIFEHEVIEEVIENARKKDKEIKAWVVGCSSGEEAYSISIAIENYLEKKQLRIPYKIFATDIDASAIEVASKGIYDEAIAIDMDPDLLEKYFIQQEHQFRIRPEIRRNIIFSTHDILRNPPFNGMDFVSCRNMLIYFNGEAQRKALKSIHFATKLDGYVFLGSSESIGVLSDFFHVINRKAKIFKNILRPSSAGGNVMKWGISSVPLLGGKRKSSSNKEMHSPFICNTLLEFLDAVSIIINERADIIHAYGNLRKYVTFPEKGFSNNLLNLLPPEFSVAVRAAIREINEKDNVTQVTKEIKALVSGHIVKIEIRVDKIKNGDNQSGVYLVSMLETLRKEIAVTDEEPTETELRSYVKENRALQQALDETHKNLQMTIEELETYNEEIQATNEELIASNEELQSTNEELQTVNEELHTVNTELIEKIAELQEANADMDNFINSLSIGTLFLDKEFRLRRFTPQIDEQIPLDETDIGRPIRNFSWSDKHLLRDSEKVLKTLQPIRKEIQNMDGVWYLQQILPYRTQDDEIKGVVINFFNIDSLKRAIIEKEYYNNLFNQVSALTPGIIYIFDFNKSSNIYRSGGVTEMLGYSDAEIRKFDKNLMPNIIHEDDLPGIYQHFEDLKKLKDDSIRKLEYRVKHKNQSIRWLSSLDRVFERNNKGEVVKTIGFVLDITQEKEKLNEIERLNHFLANINKVMPCMIYVYEVDFFRSVYLAGSTEAIFGYTLEEVKAIGDRIGANLFLPDSFNRYNEHISQMIERNKDTAYRIELQAKKKNGDTTWVELTEKVFERDKNGKPTKIMGIGVGIQALKTTELQLQSNLQLFESLHQLSIFDPSDFVSNLNEILEKLRDYFDTDCGIISKIDGKEHLIVAGSFENGIDLVGRKRNLEETFCAITIKQKGVVSLVNLKENETFKNHPLVQKENINAYLGTRMDINGVPFGTLCFWNNIRERSVFTDQQINMIDTLSNWFSKIFERQLVQEELEDTVDQLKQSNNDLERFNYIASHDLKEPLNSIISVIDLLRMDMPVEDEHLNKLLSIFEESADRMKKLINDLLSHGLLGQGEFVEEEIDLNSILDMVVNDLKDQIESTKAIVEYDQLPVIIGESTQIQLLFQNLINNGIKYNKNKPVIKIKAKEQAKNWLFTVVDNGIGVAKKNHQSVFELFKKLHPKSEYIGSGIGLANCKRIVTNHGGTIWIESTLGQGASFYFTIPK